ncbi:copper chaperone PCu(A)C [Streptomyces sp. NEAU-W12]|uniref:copper chaperone PCu(A)C n=1 Tax=Streptomyces sp. NEAU-W12 TaxID=2994668 RepID=UPI00224B7815|nr:copper chaperone PCu(A)C [Streptomyces sp. NEAU-W12]MCX2924441.1 copper chaperone PCu(A)C [Streptomyces sp. NEAU-W12]
MTKMGTSMNSFPRLGRSLRRTAYALVSCCLAATMLAGCTTHEGEYNPPGANARVGNMLIRYAHISEPPNGPWEIGDDAPLYVWLYNEGPTADRLLGAETTIARSVDIVTGDGAERGPVEVPPEKLVKLEEDRPHLLLRGLKEEMRGGDYAWVTLRFEQAGEVALQMHAQLPTYVDEDATDAPGLTSPSPEE